MGMIDKKLMVGLGDEFKKRSKEMNENLGKIERHLINIQENQLEFEKYLKDIHLKLDKITNKLIVLEVQSDAKSSVI